MRASLGILADDLTGAMDAGVQLTRTGVAVRVVLHHGAVAAARGAADAVVVDTESRNIGPDEARENVRNAAALLAAGGMPLFYKKIDSTLRGNVGRELQAIIDARRGVVCVVAPALPAAGRTTLKGIAYVGELPLAETEYAKDALKPFESSRIADIIRAQWDAKIAEVEAGSYGRGGSGLVRSIETLRAREVRIVVCDAVTEADLEAVADAAAVLGERVVPCGSAGLLDRIAARRRKTAGGETNLSNDAVRAADAGGEAGARGAPGISAAPVLVVSGSPARATRGQIDRARDALPNVSFVTFDLPKFFLSKEEADREAERAGCAAAEALEADRDVVIDGAPESRDSDSRAVGSEVTAARGVALRRALARVAAALAEGGLFRSLVLVGGDTAIETCRALGCSAIGIAREIERYVPAGRMIGGVCDGMTVVTKAGGFGSADCLTAIIGNLRGSA